MSTVRSILAALPFAVAALSAHAVVPQVEHVAQPARIRCGVAPDGQAIGAVHADKIVFRIIGPLVAQLPFDQAMLDAVPKNTELDIKVLDDPQKVADLKAKVLTFMGAQNSPPNRQNIAVGQVLYAMVCPDLPFVPPPAN